MPVGRSPSRPCRRAAGMRWRRGARLRPQRGPLALVLVGGVVGQVVVHDDVKAVVGERAHHVQEALVNGVVGQRGVARAIRRAIAGHRLRGAVPAGDRDAARGATGWTAGSGLTLWRKAGGPRHRSLGAAAAQRRPPAARRRRCPCGVRCAARGLAANLARMRAGGRRSCRSSWRPEGAGASGGKTGRWMGRAPARAASRPRAPCRPAAPQSARRRAAARACRRP